MKYLDAEKLKTEITRLKGQLIRGACASQTEMETNCKDEAYNEVLAIITSLQQEQQPTGLDGAPTSPDFDTEVYNWLREHGSDETRQLIEMTARHFWGMGRRDERMEMMKDAMEGIVIDEDMFGNKICVAKIPKDSSFKKRGLVKAIIVMEDEQ